MQKEDDEERGGSTQLAYFTPQVMGLGAGKSETVHDMKTIAPLSAV